MVEPAQTPAPGAGGTWRRFGADLPMRAAAGVAMMIIALVAAWVGGFWFLVFWFLAAALVLWEWQTLVGGERLLARLGVGALTLAAVAPFALNGSAKTALAVLIVGSALTGLAAEPITRRRLWAGAGVLYAGALLASPVLLRASPAYGLASILWLFAVVWGADIMAYFGGRLIGGPKLWPRVSPGKTWSGALVGVLSGALLGVIVVFFAAPSGTRFLLVLALGLAAAVIEALGDLFESAIKRSFDVKDSSHLIPGHGGLMDRLDGFVAAALFAAVVGWTRGEGDWIASGLFR